MNDHDALPWQPRGPGFSLKLLRGGTDDDTRALLLRLEPGTAISRHRHLGEVHAWNVAGRRRILESGEEIGPGGYVHEPPGNVDSWMAVGDEPLVVFVTVRGAIEGLDDGGNVVSRDSTASVSASYRAFVAALRAPLAVLVTVLEGSLGLALVAGFRTRTTSLCAGVLLSLFAAAMTAFTGAKSALDYSVWSAAAGAFLLSAATAPEAAEGGTATSPAPGGVSAGG